MNKILEFICDIIGLKRKNPSENKLFFEDFYIGNEYYLIVHLYKNESFIYNNILTNLIDNFDTVFYFRSYQEMEYILTECEFDMGKNNLIIIN